jgi:hypothetical protein
MFPQKENNKLGVSVKKLKRNEMFGICLYLFYLDQI